jgi:predicted O-methyltransferase YrrM
VATLRFIWKYIIYRLKATKERNTHSPFVSSLLMDVIYINQSYYAYNAIEKLRISLLNSKDSIPVIDLGALATGSTPTVKKISDIVNYAAKQPKYAQLLFRLVNHFQPHNVLELGTSLGISTAYLASANKKIQVTTIEGSKELTAVARKNFNQLKLNNIKQLTGNFDDVLEPFIQPLERLDFVFFDGNHTEEATLRYFNICIEKAHTHTVFVFDDIYWSDGMTQAWERIKKNTRVSITIDLFVLGLVFFEEEPQKQDFIIKF